MNQRWTMMALLTLLGGCSGWSPSTRYAVALDAASFIRAVRAGDQAEIDAYVDWPAVRSDIEAQIAQGKDPNGALLPAAQDWSSGATDRMLWPSRLHFKATPGSFGGVLGAAHLALMVRTVDHGRLCLSEGLWKQSCVLTFAREGGQWKVVGMSLELFHGDDAHRWSI